MASRNGKLLHRHTDSWEPVFARQEMPKSASEKNQARSWNPSFFWFFTGAVILFHLCAVFVVLPRLSGGNQSNFAFQASSFSGNEQRLGVSVEKEEEISVSATSGLLPTSLDSIINLDHGDPTMYEKFWRQTGNAAELVIPGSQTMSYFSDVTNLCWFLEPDFAAEIRRLHRLVGNALVGPDSYIIVGTGSSQLFQAALFALATSPEVFSHGDGGRPLPVVSSIPYYSVRNLVKDDDITSLWKMFC